MKILRLTLKRQWFRLIASGEKREEYRVPTPWILSRLEGKQYDRIEFKNGYGANVPTMEVEYVGWDYDFGVAKWGATPGAVYATIYLGKVLSMNDAAKKMIEPKTEKP